MSEQRHIDSHQASAFAEGSYRSRRQKGEMGAGVI